MPPPHPPSTTILDPTGNYHLHTPTTTFLISTKALALASPVWRALFERWTTSPPSSPPSSPWEEAEEEEEEDGNGIFTDDDPAALAILLRIAHLRFGELPGALVGFGEVVGLAVVCDKYDTVELVRPWISKWLAPLQAQAEGTSCGGGEEEGACYEGYETWLFIAWTFGDEGVFRRISRSLVLTATVTTVDGERRLVNGQGVMVGETMPPGSVDAIVEARSGRISALLDICYRLVDRYESTSLGDTTVCARAHSSKECDALVYGCLIKGLQSLDLFPKRATASEIELSVVAFADELRSLTCFAYPSSYRFDSFNGYYSADPVSHSDCGFTVAFANQIRAVIGQKEPSGVLEAHLAHIDEQKE